MKKKPRRQLKKNVRKRLQKEVESKWKEYCHKRDGDGCQVQKHFPKLDFPHSEVYQIDHCFPRANKELFILASNGTKVCSNCNFSKQWNKALDLAINDIVIKREGLDKFEYMRSVASQRGAFLLWKSIAWLERQISILEEMTEEL